MQQPRLTGFTVDSRPYEFTAQSAEQDITKPDVMELHHIDAKMEMEDKSTVTVTSNSGTYDMKTEMLTLSESVHLVSSTGYEVRMTRGGDRRPQRQRGVGETGLGEAHQRRAHRQPARRGRRRRRHSIQRRRFNDDKAGPGIHAGAQTMKRRLWLWAISIALAAPGLAAAQGPRAVSAPAPVTGLQEQKEQNQDQPIQIEVGDA